MSGFSNFANAQQPPSLSENVTDKVVIGLPGLSNQQLLDIKLIISNSSQIVVAKFVYDDHNCLLLSLNTNGSEFKQFYDLLKIFSQTYPMEKMYIKPYSVYDEIDNKLKGLTVTNIK
ncbi:MAG: hypothetical protein H0W61_17300 [Bacteroidetes bacterium]|nr:hypothetical protein [Bacteroidota bacterium]